MTKAELARLGKVMRDAQKRYFHLKDPADLKRSKDLERRFDDAVRDELNHQRMLVFAEEGGDG